MLPTLYHMLCLGGCGGVVQLQVYDQDMIFNITVYVYGYILLIDA